MGILELGDPAGERDFREPRIQRDPGFRKDASGGDASLGKPLRRTVPTLLRFCSSNI